MVRFHVTWCSHEILWLTGLAGSRQIGFHCSSIDILNLVYTTPLICWCLFLCNNHERHPVSMPIRTLSFWVCCFTSPISYMCHIFDMISIDECYTKHNTHLFVTKCNYSLSVCSGFILWYIWESYNSPSVSQNFFKDFTKCYVISKALV